MELRKIIKKCIKNDHKAFDKLYNLYAPILAGITRRYANSTEEVDDILQESFIKIFNNLNQLSDWRKFDAWAKRIVINTALKSLKNTNLFNLRIDYLDIDLSNDDETKSLEIMSDLDISDLIKLMDQLPEGYKTILNLYAIEEYSHKEIAEILHIKEATSRSQYFKAKKAFQKILLETMKDEIYEEFHV